MEKVLKLENMDKWMKKWEDLFEIKEEDKNGEHINEYYGCSLETQYGIKPMTIKEMNQEIIDELLYSKKD